MDIFRLLMVMLTIMGCGAKKSAKGTYPVETIKQLYSECIKQGSDKAQCDCRVQALQTSGSWTNLKQGAIKKQRGVTSTSFDKHMAKATSTCKTGSHLEHSFIRACQQNASIDFCKCTWKKVASNTSEKVAFDEMEKKEIEAIIAQSINQCERFIDTKGIFLKQCISSGQMEKDCRCMYQALNQKHGTSAINKAMLKLPWEKRNTTLNQSSLSIKKDCLKNAIH